MTYRGVIGGLILSVALTLLTLVDVRRGFLFADYPVRSLFYGFHPWHGLMLVLGIAGMWACYLASRKLEARLSGTSQYVKALALILLALLVIDLFAYRGVPAARSMASGRVNLDWVKGFGVTAWWKPVAQATSYVLNVWHATMLSILISGLALTILPVYFKAYLPRAGFTGSLFGALFALPQPFCSCCSSVMAPSFVQRGASTTFLLSFVVGAPMLNMTTIILALALLPARFAILRILAGVIVTVPLTYLVVRIGEWWDGPNVATTETAPRSGLGQRIGAWYLNLFDVDRLVGSRDVQTPSRLVSAWLYASARVAMVLVPTLWVWSVIASAIFQALPSAFGNNLTSVALSAIGGTFFMISTWSEIPMALQFIQAGFTGPAAALLVVLPAISLPCMMLLGGALRRFRLVALLSGSVMIAGILAGAMFL